MTAFRFPRIRAALSSVFYNPYKAAKALKVELRDAESDRDCFSAAYRATHGRFVEVLRDRKRLRGEVLSLQTQRNSDAETFRFVISNWQDLVQDLTKQLEGYEMAADAFMVEREELQQSISAFQKEREELKATIAECGFQGLTAAELAQGLLEGLQAISADNVALIVERDELAAHIPYLKAVEAKLASSGVIVTDTEEGPVVTIDVPTVVAGLKSGETKAMPQPIPAA